MRIALLLSALAVLAVGRSPRFDHEQALRDLADKRGHIAAVGKDFTSRLPEGYSATLEFNGSRSMDFMVYPPSFRPGRDSKAVTEWDVTDADPEVIRGLGMIRWTRQDIRLVRKQVRAIGGIGISGPLAEGGVRIRYKRVGMGMDTFVVADYIDTRTALEYGGGAIGSQCMPPPETW